MSWGPWVHSVSMTTRSRSPRAALRGMGASLRRVVAAGPVQAGSCG
ncbi:hypothetical protein [Ornithinimicrobium kibberense]